MLSTKDVAAEYCSGANVCQAVALLCQARVLLYRLYGETKGWAERSLLSALGAFSVIRAFVSCLVLRVHLQEEGSEDGSICDLTAGLS